MVLILSWAFMTSKKKEINLATSLNHFQKLKQVLIKTKEIESPLYSKMLEKRKEKIIRPNSLFNLWVLLYWINFLLLDYWFSTTHAWR